jgi:hypothetical protein
MSRLLAGLCVGCLLSITPSIRAEDCPAGSVRVGDARFMDIVNEAADATAEDTSRRTELVAAAPDAPLEVPAATKLAAASGTTTTTGLIDEPSLPTLLGLAVDSGLVASSNQALTVNVNLFAFKALADPEVVDRQSKYEAYDRLRRFGGSVSLGGNGDSFDRDGDGVTDPALQSTSLGDIVNWDVEYRFIGSRDRRDPVNYRRIISAVDSEFIQGADTYRKIVIDVVHAFPAAQCVPEADVKIYLSVQLAQAREQLAQADSALRDKFGAAVKAIDANAVWTLALTGTERHSEFGPDTLGVAIRGAGGIGVDTGSGWAANASWERIFADVGADSSAIKLGAQYARFLLKGRYGLRDGIKFSAAGAFEWYDNVPDALHDNIAKANIKIEIPIRNGISIPLSVTWADHKDLLSDESEVRGNIGFTFNVSPGELLKSPSSTK